jgi:hypothetical protein
MNVFIEFLQQGFIHVLPLGYDHLLFIASLFFIQPKLKPLLIQCSVFTLAHSFSLVLAAKGILPGNLTWIEPLIAFTIVLTALEGIFQFKNNNVHLLILFIFGFIHGMGFASALIDLGLPKNEFLPGLLGFNLGVELAQVSILLFLSLLLGKWITTKPWYEKRISLPCCSLIGCIATYWTISRLTFIQL